MQLPRAHHEYTAAKRAGVNTYILEEPSGDPFLGNIISLGVIERARCIDICRIEQMFFSCAISRRTVLRFVHPFNVSCNS